MSLTWHIEIFIERDAPLGRVERQALTDHVDRKRRRLGRHGYRFEIAADARADRLVARGELDMPWSVDHKDLPHALEALDDLAELLPRATVRVRDTLEAIHWSDKAKGFALEGPAAQQLPRYQPGGTWIAARPPPAIPGVAPGAPADEAVRVAWSLFHSLAETPSWEAVRALEPQVTDWTPVAVQFVALWRAASKPEQRWALSAAASERLCAHPLVEELVASELAAGERDAIGLAYLCRGPGSLVGLARRVPENVHRRGDPASLPTTLLQLARGKTYLAGEAAAVLGDDAAAWLHRAALEYGPRAVVKAAVDIASPAVQPILEELVRFPDLRDQALRVLLARDPVRGVAALEWLMSGDRGGLMSRAVVGELLKGAADPDLQALSAEVAALRDQDEAIRARLESWSGSRGAARWQGEATPTPEDWITAVRARLEPLAIRVDAAFIADLERREAEWMASVPIARPRATRPPAEAGPALTIGAWLATGKPDRKAAARAVKEAGKARDDASLAALIELARRDRDGRDKDALRVAAVKALAGRADPRSRATLCLEIACAPSGSYAHAIEEAASGLAVILGAAALPWIARAALGANPELLPRMSGPAKRLPAAESALMLRQLARFGTECRSNVSWRAAVEQELGPVAARAGATAADLVAEEVSALAALRSPA